MKLVSPEKVLSLNCDTAFRCPFPEVLHCCGIQIVNDTVLVLQDQVSDSNPYHFKAYSTNTFAYMGSFIRNGRGPGELVQPHIAKSNTLERYLSVNVNQEGKAYKLDVDESIKSREAAVIPLPKPETTPPVTNICLLAICRSPCSCFCAKTRKDAHPPARSPRREMDVLVLTACYYTPPTGGLSRKISRAGRLRRNAAFCIWWCPSPPG